MSTDLLSPKDYRKAWRGGKAPIIAEIPDEPDDDIQFDCGQSDDGLCQYAGSEWCDFMCPHRDEM